MKYLPRFLIGLILILIGACDPKLDNSINDLVTAKYLWEKSGYGKNYSFTFAKNCNSQVSKPNVFVTNGVAYALNEKGEVTNKISEGTAFTIKGLMDHILELIKEEQKGALRFEVKYDPNYGYPTYLKVNPKSGGMDSRYEICISNLTINGA